jgi:hypothetical protein
MDPVTQAATTVAATETDLSNDFDAVFDAIMKGDTGNETSDKQTPDGAAVAADDDKQSGEPGNGAGDPGESTAAGGDATPADGKGQSAGGDDDADSGDKGGKTPVVDYAAQIAALTAQIEAMKTAPAAAEPKATEAKEIPIYSTAEAAELETLQKDWPELKRLFELMSRQVEVNMVNYTFAEMGKILTPLQQSVGVLTGNDHVGAIYSAHPDYDQAYDPCMEWIGKQPAFLKGTYERIVKDGTSQEVAEMMQKFKDETKWTAQAAATTVTPAAAAAKVAPKTQVKAELSDAAKKAAQAIGVVGAKRGGAVAVQDPLDYEGAWAEATASK